MVALCVRNESIEMIQITCDFGIVFLGTRRATRSWMLC